MKLSEILRSILAAVARMFGGKRTSKEQPASPAAEPAKTKDTRTDGEKLAERHGDVVLTCVAGYTVRLSQIEKVTGSGTYNGRSVIYAKGIGYSWTFDKATWGSYFV